MQTPSLHRRYKNTANATSQRCLTLQHHSHHSAPLLCDSTFTTFKQRLQQQIITPPPLKAQRHFPRPHKVPSLEPRHAKMTSTVTPEEKPGKQTRGLWFKLPTELRLEIYELMFPRETISLVTFRDQLEKKANVNCSAGDYVAILHPCYMPHDSRRSQARPLREHTLRRLVLFRIYRYLAEASQHPASSNH